MSRLVVGQRVWITDRRGYGVGGPRTVIVVGKKWATLDGRGGRVTVEPEPHRGFYLYDLGAYGTADALTDEQHVAERQLAAVSGVRQSAIEALRVADPEMVLTICRLLDIPVPDALPTAAEVLALHGVTL